MPSGILHKQLKSYVSTRYVGFIFIVQKEEILSTTMWNLIYVRNANTIARIIIISF